MVQQVGIFLGEVDCIQQWYPTLVARHFRDTAIVRWSRIDSERRNTREYSDRVLYGRIVNEEYTKAYESRSLEAVFPGYFRSAGELWAREFTQGFLTVPDSSCLLSEGTSSMYTVRAGVKFWKYCFNGWTFCQLPPTKLYNFVGQEGSTLFEPRRGRKLHAYMITNW